jgi:hypothetical protein
VFQNESIITVFTYFRGLDHVGCLFSGETSEAGAIHCYQLVSRTQRPVLIGRSPVEHLRLDGERGGGDRGREAERERGSSNVPEISWCLLTYTT